LFARVGAENSLFSLGLTKPTNQAKLVCAEAAIVAALWGAMKDALFETTKLRLLAEPEHLLMPRLEAQLVLLRQDVG
jgi:hypothetical protein